jgi:hypothetical protein
MLKSPWPNDADGDVFRRLESTGFDFSQMYSVDFNVDFDEWPPSPAAIEAICQTFPDCKVNGEDEPQGYVLFKVRALLTYDFVIKIQNQATRIASPFGGRCESWGVLQL